jgi:hypothetical protein
MRVMMLNILGAVFYVVGGLSMRLGAMCWQAADRAQGKPEWRHPSPSRILDR